MTGRLPDFLGIGTQKGGTTSLQKLLEQHPDAFLPITKEIHYFTLHYNESEHWYRGHFQQANREQICGEITPYYLFHPEAPQRIQALLPKARLIVLLRDPVERALSQYFHARRLGFEELDLKAALAAESQRLASGNPYSHQKHSYLSRSRYELQLQRYQRLFKPHQLLILRSEDFFDKTERSWKAIQNFLGLRESPLPVEAIKANAGLGEVSTVAPRVRAWIKGELADTFQAMQDQYGMTWS
ncbi:MAG: sulfotransferase [Synechococcus sp. XM-24]|nr:MAG: sulfotransferase [Synechococcus sp. XM-24]